MNMAKLCRIVFPRGKFGGWPTTVCAKSHGLTVPARMHGYRVRKHWAQGANARGPEAMGPGVPAQLNFRKWRASLPDHNALCGHPDTIRRGDKNSKARRDDAASLLLLDSG